MHGGTRILFSLFCKFLDAAPGCSSCGHGSLVGWGCSWVRSSRSRRTSRTTRNSGWNHHSSDLVFVNLGGNWRRQERPSAAPPSAFQELDPRLRAVTAPSFLDPPEQGRPNRLA